MLELILEMLIGFKRRFNPNIPALDETSPQTHPLVSRAILLFVYSRIDYPWPGEIEFAPFSELLRIMICVIGDKRQSADWMFHASGRRVILVTLLSLPLLFSTVSCASFTFRPDPPLTPVAMIYDDDCDGDIDCTVTQPILHRWIDLNYVKVWGMVSSAHSQQGASTLRIFRDYYKHNNLFSIGAWTPECGSNPSGPVYVAIVNQFAPGDSCTNYKNCAQVLRQSVASYIASGGDPHGLDYVITGPLTCEEAFRNSPVDAISPMTGAEMEKNYIKQFVLMNGLAPSGVEYNCAKDADACSMFFADVTSGNGYPPVYVLPLNTGAVEVVTQIPVSSLPQSNPTAYAFAVAGLRRSSDEDILTMEFAVYGTPGWGVGRNSTNSVEPVIGLDRWSSRSQSGQYYLTVAGDARVFEGLFDNPWVPTTSTSSALEPGTR